MVVGHLLIPGSERGKKRGGGKLDRSTCVSFVCINSVVRSFFFFFFSFYFVVCRTVLLGKNIVSLFPCFRGHAATMRPPYPPCPVRALSTLPRLEICRLREAKSGDPYSDSADRSPWQEHPAGQQGRSSIRALSFSLSIGASGVRMRVFDPGDVVAYQAAPLLRPGARRRGGRLELPRLPLARLWCGEGRERETPKSKTQTLTLTDIDTDVWRGKGNWTYCLSRRSRPLAAQRCVTTVRIRRLAYVSGPPSSVKENQSLSPGGQAGRG
ncbi:hypothetical protein LY76DRAFT_287651 [Colletotrichum caudatum]|nr:hypothetical protein LY76DRAFT_287651 [Colletotrichum caudatum]